MRCQFKIYVRYIEKQDFYCVFVQCTCPVNVLGIIFEKPIQTLIHLYYKLRVEPVLYLPHFLFEMPGMVVASG